MQQIGKQKAARKDADTEMLRGIGQVVGRHECAVLGECTRQVLNVLATLQGRNLRP
jgi:hypothetical protein